AWRGGGTILGIGLERRWNNTRLQGGRHSGSTCLKLWWKNLSLRWSLLLVGLEEDKQSTLALGYQVRGRDESGSVAPKKYGYGDLGSNGNQT
ncbi:hypothetical protein L195_g061719, partial [Trifolium pratense]